ncbi:MAG: hypothetical protein AMJ79_09745 [Phycisphaerae bacterium SM23_30]|nr:MAG: hypothetical protein AMJ79_09745 [Phycisphaerae bacterium SM23_30]
MSEAVLDEYFEKPINPDDKIWRYMDIEKYVSLITSKSLYFARLHEFEDHFEGSFWPTKILKPDFKHSNISESDKAVWKKNAEDNKKYMAVSCWHLSEYESDAMWKIYAKYDKGIAIQSTYGSLCEELKNAKKNLPYLHQINRVKYIDHFTELFRDGGAMWLFDGVLHKHKSFEYEKELRAVLYTSSSNIESHEWLNLQKGIPIPLDNFSVFIKKVITSPYSQERFYKMLKSVSEKYGLVDKVLKSELTEKLPY